MVLRLLWVSLVCVPSIAACAQPASNNLGGLLENFRAKKFEAAEAAIQGSISGSAYKSPAPRKTLTADQFVTKIKPCTFYGVPTSTGGYAVLQWNCPKPVVGEVGSAPMYVLVRAQAIKTGVQLSDWCEATYDNRQDC